MAEDSEPIEPPHGHVASYPGLSDRLAVVEAPLRLDIRIRAVGPERTLLVAAFECSILAFLAILVAVVASTDSDAPAWLLAFIAAVVMAVFVINVAYYLWWWRGTELIVVVAGNLERTLALGPLKLRRTFRGEEVLDMRAQGPYHSFWPLEWGFNPYGFGFSMELKAAGAIAFDYRGKARSVGLVLPEREAQFIVDKIQAGFEAGRREPAL